MLHTISSAAVDTVLATDQAAPAIEETPKAKPKRKYTKRPKEEPAPPKPEDTWLIHDCARLIQIRNDASAKYKEAAELEDELIGRLEAQGGKLDLTPVMRRSVTVKDNFASANVHWKSTPVKRKEIALV